MRSPSRRPSPFVARLPRAACLAVWLTWCAVASQVVVAVAGGDTSADLRAALLTRSNEAREREGLGPLESDEGLQRAAQAHADDLARRGALTHEGTEPARATPARRVAAAGVALVEIAENLALIEGSDVAERAVAGWLESPEHRRNLLNEAYDVAGHGVAHGAEGTYLVGLLGARPLTRTRLTATPAQGPAEQAAPGDPVRLEIRYREPDQPLLLFVDGEHRQGAAAGAGVLTTELPLPEAPVRVSVGLDEGGGRARIVEEFTLAPGPPPTLTPGAPAPVGEAGGGEE